jgi:hypothetical protein
LDGDEAGSIGELCGACLRVRQERGANDDVPTLMADRQRRARELADWRTQLWLVAPICGCLLADRNRLPALHVNFCFARRRRLQPPAVHVRAVASVLLVARISRRALARVIVGSGRLGDTARDAGSVAVGDVERCVLTGSIRPSQLLVRCVTVVRVREQGFGRVQAKAQCENARGEAAQD